MRRTIDRDGRGRRLRNAQKTGDRTRVNLRDAALFFSLLPVPSPPFFFLRRSSDHSIFIAESINGKPVSIVCSALRPLPSSCTPHYRNVSPHQCLYLSLPRVTLNFLCPGRRDTSLNSHNYSSSPLTI